MFYRIDALVNEKRWKLQDTIRTEYIEKLEALNRGDYFNGTYFAPSSIVDDWIYNGATPDYSDDSELAAIYEDFKKDYVEYRFYENLSGIIMSGENYDYDAQEWRPITSEEKTLGEILPTINPKVAQGLPINMQQENVKTIKKLLFIMSVKKIINSFCCEA